MSELTHRLKGAIAIFQAVSESLVGRNQRLLLKVLERLNRVFDLQVMQSS